jgi:flagellin-specific chaperone FliS
MGKSKPETGANEPPKTVDSEVDYFTAKEGMRNGKPQDVACYVRDVSKILSRLANMLDPPDGQKEKWSLKFVSQSGADRRKPETEPAEAREWYSDYANASECIEAGKAAPVGWYLRDTAEILDSLGRTLDPQHSSREWGLRFVRRRRGKPSDRDPKNFFKKDAIPDLVKSRTDEGGKVDFAVADVAQARGISRATVYRAIKGKGPRSRKKRNK